MSATVAEDTRKPTTWWDRVFFILFALFVISSLLLLLQGIGAVIASRSEGFYASLQLRELGTGLSARIAKRMATASFRMPSGIEIAMGYAFSVVNIALAIFLLWLRPRDRTARLLAIGIVGTAGVFNLPAQLAYEAVPLNLIESAIQTSVHIVSGLAYGLALVLFPDGRLVPRWKRWQSVALYIPFTLAVAFLAVRAQGTARPAALLIFFGLAVPAAGVAAQAYRFRRAAAEDERAQARLLFWALIPALAVGVFFIATQGFGPVTEPVLAGRHIPQAHTGIFRIFQPVFLLVPVALFFGLVRYKLWAIDRVVNRTLVFGLLTGLLLGAYYGIVVILQWLLPIDSNNRLVVALSTLAVAAAFVPLRRRVQAFVDRRFYRHRYDAQETVDAFIARLRNEVDLEALGFELRGAAGRTMQPTHMTLHIRDEAGGQGWQWTYRGRPRS